MLCSYSEQDIDRTDKCNRTIHDVATDDCKDLLENLSECFERSCVHTVTAVCVLIVVYPRFILLSSNDDSSFRLVPGLGASPVFRQRNGLCGIG